jgi:DNA-binding GntR family transcriptional regulator
METSQGRLLSKSAAAYEHIKGLAICGELRPGRRLSPPDVASLLRTSVTPVRDALARLAAEGFVSGSDGRGYFTKPACAVEQLELETLLALALFASLQPVLGGERRRGEEALADLETKLGNASTGASSATAMGAFIFQAVSTASNGALSSIVANAVERTALLRRLDLEDPARREAELVHLRELVGAFGRPSVALDLLARGLAGWAARLPELAARANASSSHCDFP